jgi:hypothetical protein
MAAVLLNDEMLIKCRKTHTGPTKIYTIFMGQKMQQSKDVSSSPFDSQV